MTVARMVPKSQYSAEAHAAFDELDRRVNVAFEEVKAWRGWALIQNPSTPPEIIVRLVREIFRAVAWYQPHTTEAGFHMFGRFPKRDVKLIQAVCGHKAEEAEHGVWAAEDHGKLGGSAADIKVPASPATFAVAGVWWHIARTEEPLGYLGAEYLFEQLTALVAPAVLPVIEGRKLNKDDGFRFVIEHAVEDQKHAVFLKHLIMDVVTRYPGSEQAMYRCYDYFKFVYPIPVWEEALERTLAI